MATVELNVTKIYKDLFKSIGANLVALFFTFSSLMRRREGGGGGCSIYVQRPQESIVHCHHLISRVILEIYYTPLNLVLLTSKTR